MKDSGQNFSPNAKLGICWNSRFMISLMVDCLLCFFLPSYYDPLDEWSFAQFDLKFAWLDFPSDRSFSFLFASVGSGSHEGYTYVLCYKVQAVNLF